MVKKLKLLVHENTSSGEKWFRGEEDYVVDVQVGTRFSTKLLKNPNHYEIVSFDGESVKIHSNDGNDFIVDFDHPYHDDEDYGYNTQYDYVHFERYFSIKLVEEDE